jgi:hypothetical protein
MIDEYELKMDKQSLSLRQATTSRSRKLRSVSAPKRMSAGNMSD